MVLTNRINVVLLSYFLLNKITSFVKLFLKAQRQGRVDVVVQSTDKNFLVPVGGSILVTFDSLTSNSLCSLYPGSYSSLICF